MHRVRINSKVMPYMGFGVWERRKGMKKRKRIVVLGTGQVVFLTVVFVALFLCLITAFILLRERDRGTAAAALFFAIAAFLAAVFLLAAYFSHKKEDSEREAAWDELEKKRQKHS